MSSRRQRILGIGLALFFGLFAVVWLANRDVKLSALKTRLVDPAEAGVLLEVVFERSDRIYFSSNEDRSSALVAEGCTYPRWVPGRNAIACLRGQDLLLIDFETREERVLSVIEKPYAINVHPNGKEVLFTNRGKVQSVGIDHGEVKTLAEGYTFYEIDISADGKRLAATVKGKSTMGYQVRAFDLEKDTSWKIGRGCAAGLSSNGDLVSNLTGNHTELLLRRWEDAERMDEVLAPDGLHFDNHSWAHQGDWIVYQSEKSADVYAHHLSKREAYRLTAVGDVNRPDLRVSPFKKE